MVGGGIGGLAAAAFLHRAGIQAVVYEQAAELTEIGAGLVLAPNAARLLRRLGLYERLAEVGVPLETGWQFRRWQDGRVLFEQPLGKECERLYGEATWVLHRAHLLDMLRSKVPDEAVRLGMRCTGAEQDGDGVTLGFADGSRAGADVVVAADGVHSTLRDHVTPSPPAHSFGVCAWRCLIPAEAAPELARHPVQTVWLGPGRHLVHYPVSAGTKINVVAFSPAAEDDVESWTSQGKPADLVTEFADWDPRVGELLSTATTVGRWAVLDRDPLRPWVKGRLALLGDAAHPMLPLFAQGAGQAIEDAAVLATCLADGREEPLECYERIRLDRAHKVQRVSRGRLQLNHLPDGPEQVARDAAFAGENPLRHNSWLYSYDAEEACR